MRLPSKPLLFLLLLASGASAQTTRRVPAEFAKIQQEIDASAAGDTVLVAPGTYVETLNFKGKNITVRSSAGAAMTIIDGNKAGPVVTRVAAALAELLRPVAVPLDTLTDERRPGTLTAGPRASGFNLGCSIPSPRPSPGGRGEICSGLLLRCSGSLLAATRAWRSPRRSAPPCPFPASPPAHPPPAR